MEKYTDMVENLTEGVSMKKITESNRKDQMFSAADIPEIVRVFKKYDADGSGGLDMEEFAGAMREIYGSLNTEDLQVLHMQIDANCDLNVDIGELLDFLLNKQAASEHCRNDPFPFAFNVIPVGHYKTTAALSFHPKDTVRVSEKKKIRKYMEGHYFSISSDGVFNIWNDSFEKPYKVPLYKKESNCLHGHKKIIHVTDMVYIYELNEVAISTTDRELIFYHFRDIPREMGISHSIILDDNINVMNYWSDGTKALFSFGDTKGNFYVFYSKNVSEDRILCSKAFEKLSLHPYPTVYLSTLLRTRTKGNICVRLPVLKDVCSEIQYIPSIDSYTICGCTSRTMAMVPLPKLTSDLHKTKEILKNVQTFHSKGNQDFFKCAAYSHSADRLLTGGTDGFLRVWFRHNTTYCEHAVKKHVKPITHIVFNHIDQLLISISEDMNVCVWSDGDWQCRQSFQIHGMGGGRITSMYYNVHNNELILANKNIGKTLGRGTNLSEKMLTSHDKPLCGVLYHSIFKQVVSVCQNGEVTMWDILTGKAITHFKITVKQQVGHTAISFDETQRRLITISQDGKVRLWNFNSATELSVLPVTVTKEVTGIVCINGRMFVSSKTSKMIFNLDTEGDDHRFLRHSYLDDISSMDFHGGTLITASSNGNVIIWNIETEEAIYFMNTKEKPQTMMAHKHGHAKSGILRPVEKNQKRIKDTLEKQNKNGLLVKCLRTREVALNTATILTCADGYVSAWSAKVKGGLLARFRAVQDKDAVITTMTMDISEKILLVGDNTGMIYLWDIKEFGFKKKEDKGPFEDMNGWQVSVRQPPLLGSWKACPTEVVSIACDPLCNGIITAGLDNNVQLWTNTGCNKGLFGRDHWGTAAITQEEEEEDHGEPQEEPSRQTDEQKSMLNLLNSATRPESPFDPALFLSEFTGCEEEPFFDDDDEKPVTMRDILVLERQVNKCLINLDNYSKSFNSRDQQKSEEPHLTPSSQNVCLPRYQANKKSKVPSAKDPPKKRSIYPEMTWQKDKYGLPTLKRTFPPRPRTPQFPHEPLQPEETKNLLQKSAGTKADPTNNQTQCEPHPPQTRLTTGCTEATKSSLKTQTSALTKKQASERTRRLLRLSATSKKTEESQTQIKPHPPQTRPSTGCTEAEKASERTRRLLRLPTPPEKSQLAESKTQIKPYPPRTQPSTGCTEATKSSLSTQTSALTKKQASERTRRLVRLPATSKKTEESQTQIKPHPPQTRLTTGCTEAEKASERTRRLLHLPTPSEKTRPAESKTQIKPHPPQTRHSTGCTEATKSSLSTQTSALTKGQASERTRRLSRLPATSGKAQPAESQTQIKPHPPPTSLLTGPINETIKKRVKFKQGGV